MSRAPIPGTHEPGFVEARIVRESIPPSLRQAFATLGVEARLLRRFTMGACSILVSREGAGAQGERLWHLSISLPDRHPSWDEIKTARYRLLPERVTFGLLLPPAEMYVNVPAQDHVFHLSEVNDPREPWSSL